LVAFSVASSTVLKRVDVDGGAAVRMSAGAGYGTWGPRDAVVVSQPPPSSILLRTTSLDSPPAELLKGAANERFRFPFFIPGTADYLYARRNPNDASTAGLWLGSLGSTEAKLLIPSAVEIHAFTANGYLVFSRDGSIFAQPFDPASRTLSGGPTLLAEGVDALPLGGAAFSVSQADTLVYVAQPEQGRSRLVVLDREGHTVSTVSDEADYSNIELSPDGRRVAVSAMDPSKRTRDIFLIDLARNVRQRLTVDPTEERAAVWSPDGRQVIFNSKGLDLYARASDFSGAEVPVLVDGGSKDPRGVSADGRSLLFRRSGPTGNDLWIMPLGGAGKPSPVVDTPFDENYGVFSPDARSMAYVSDESGRAEVYVLSLESGGGKVQISTAGGTFPRWRADGREILYLGPDQTIMSVAVSGSGLKFSAQTVKPLFHVDTQPGPGTPFDVSADGQRFIVNTAIPSRVPPSLTLLTNWTSLIRPEGRERRGERGRPPQ
jgi:dipeptidyl aminopeptidase/acylaminoacyl peptidase